MKMNMLCSLWFLVFGSLYLSSHASELSEKKDPWLGWHRPVNANVFATTMGNNHDSVLFVEPELEYPYHLIVSHTPKFAHLWRTKKFSWNSEDWELVSDQYKIGNFYEYDDGVKVDGTYYIYEGGKVFTYSGPLEDSSGQLQMASYPGLHLDSQNRGRLGPLRRQAGYLDAHQGH